MSVTDYPDMQRLIERQILGPKPPADPAGQAPQPPPSELEARFPRFGPVHEVKNDAIEKAKNFAWERIIGSDNHPAYLSCIMQIEEEAKRSYDTGVIERLEGQSRFREMMAKDGCFFLQVALFILGCGLLLEYSDQNPYFGEDNDLSHWIPALFFLGNQIPHVVIRALMKEQYFQRVKTEGLKDNGTLRQPPQELERLALYRVVVEPELAERPTQPANPPSDILHCVHTMLLGPGNNNSSHQNMKNFPDLKATWENDEVTFPSTKVLLRSGIRLRKAMNGISSIRFKNCVIIAYLDVPPLTIDGNTERVLRNLTSYERNLNESEREVTAYLRFIRDLSATASDVQILEEKGIIQVKGDQYRDSMFSTIDTLVGRNFTFNFHHIKRMIDDYNEPPWRLIVSFIVSCLAFVQVVFAFLPYIIAPKSE